MTSVNISFTNYNDLSTFISLHKLYSQNSMLIQIFSGVIDKNILEKLTIFLTDKLPQAKIIGSTTDGEIINDKVTTHNIVISFTLFNRSNLGISHIDIDSKDDSYEYGKQLAQELFSKISKVFIIFISGLNVNPEEFLNGVKSIAPNIIVAGGLSGDNARFKETYTICNNNILSSSAVGISINSSHLQVDNYYTLAWNNIGKTFTVNKSYENILYEIDNMTPYDLYKKYLGAEIANKLPHIGIEFPLIIQKEGEEISRAPLKLEDDGSMIFAGNIKEGSKVRFGIGNIDELINGSAQLVDNLIHKNNETIFIYSCMARRRFLESKASLDIKNFNILAPTAGFFTYGEFYSTSNSNELLNESLTLLALSEDMRINNKKRVISHAKLPNKLLKQKAISNIIDTTSKELDSLNLELENKIYEKTQENIEQEKYIFEKEKMAQMGEMLENIAHQWRQPLSAISSNISSFYYKKSLISLQINS